MKRGDLILIGALALAAAGGGAWYLASGAGRASGGDLVVVTQSRDGFYRADPLSADVEYTVETPGTGTGDDAGHGENTVRVHGGEVKVSESNCSNQLCAEHTPIAGAGEQIVCLPHGVVVQVAASEDDVAKLQ